MTELNPTEQYQAVTVKAAPGNGDKPAPAIDEQSRQEAMAKALLDNRKRQREQACGAEIDEAITAILKKHHCQVRFMELREGGNTTRIWLQPIAIDEAPSTAVMAK